ncbi:hypothetical protein B0T19DRAFT_439514 [Cercophora scortea]|uniref:Uncharacterized protein n=1 Tax=Cercophora scortea TaxID=314031 RepID=A0AAE0MHH7_9PEZI|nr:hypothetical protein B0T19DRAFT_439514 [Cercophora scortea]
MTTPTWSLGARVLGEIDEGSLEEVLTSLRTTYTTIAPDINSQPETAPTHAPAPAPTTTAHLRPFPNARLDALVNRHFRATESAPLAISGRHHELLHALVATLIAPPHAKAVAIIDFDGRFDVLRLLTTIPLNSNDDGRDETKTSPATHITTRSHNGNDGPASTIKPSALRRADLDHVHILRPPPTPTPTTTTEAVAAVEKYMLYSAHGSRAREWWGTIVIGGDLAAAAAAQGVAVTAGWKGWLRVDRAEVQTFGSRSVEEALVEREARAVAVEAAGWVGRSAWGVFEFGKGDG